jgi:hypothetical protein
MTFSLGFLKKRKPYTKHLAITPPQPDPDRQGVAIVACAKDEGAYIAEWLLFHRAVGIRHFYIYDGNSTDDTRPVIARLSDRGDITVIPWAGRAIDMATNRQLNNQTIAFSHAIMNFGSLHQWMAFIDVDEFLLPKQGTTIEEALTGAGGFPNVSLPWHMFGTSGYKTKPAGSLLKNFTERSSDPMSKKKNIRNFKCIVDPCEVTEVSIHAFGTRKFGEMTVNDSGKPATRKSRTLPEFYSSKFLQLNHYYSKSEEELLAKIERGPASPASRHQYRKRVMIAVENIEADAVEDRTMIEFIRINNIDSLGTRTVP